MRLYLVKDLPLVLSPVTLLDGGARRKYESGVTTQCVLSTLDGLPKEEKCLKKVQILLEDAFKQQDNLDKEDGVPVDNAKKMRLSPSVSANGRELRIYSDLQTYPPPGKCKSIMFGISGKILELLQRIFDRENREVWIQLTLTNFISGLRTNRKTDLKNLSQFNEISTKRMKVNLPSSESNVAFCADDDVAVPEKIFRIWLQDIGRVSAKFSVHLVFDEFNDNLLHIQNIFKNEICSDVIIVASNGTEFKCHKNFLLSHNIAAFEAMFSETYNFQEAQTGRVKMDDVSEEGVKAFLTYLYYRDIDVPSKDSGVALELLNMSNKYDLHSLKTEIVSILLDKQADGGWFTLELAVQLFVLARGMEDGETLKSVAIKVIKSKEGSQRTSAKLRILLNGNHEMLMEMVDLLIFSY